MSTLFLPCGMGWNGHRFKTTSHSGTLGFDNTEDRWGCVMLEQTWPPAEEWAWEQIRSGKIADFNRKCGHLDPINGPDERWNDPCRAIGPEFLADRLARDDVPRWGVRLVGARIDGAVDLTNARVKHEISINGCRLDGDLTLQRANLDSLLSLQGTRVTGAMKGNSMQVGQSLLARAGATFKGDVILRSARIGDQLDMSGSIFEKTVDGNGLHVGGSLFMRDRATFKDSVILRSAKIDGQLNLSSSTFEKTVSGNGLQVGRSLFMREAIFKGDVILRSAKVDGLEMDGSMFEKALDCDSLQAGRNLFMRAGATFKGDVVLLGTKIDGPLDMNNSTFGQNVKGEGLQVARDLFMREAVFYKRTFLVFSHIGGSLDVRGASFTGLDFSGTMVGRELVLAEEGMAVSWQSQDQDNPALILRNTHVGALHDIPEAWPSSVDLDGFTYNKLGGFGARSNRPVKDWTDWLAKDEGQGRQYSPQPYAQLAGVLAAAGRRDQANAIQFAGRKREQREARQQVQEAWQQVRNEGQGVGHLMGEILAAVPRRLRRRPEAETAPVGQAQPVRQALGRWWRRLQRWFWLTALRYLIGYGIGRYTFRVLYWVVGSALVGMMVLRFCVPAAKAQGVIWCFFASLDRLLPIVELNKQFTTFFEHLEFGSVFVFFVVLRSLGWVLASFLVVALTGLTQKT